MSSILVTGGAGFIGSHLVDALIESGHQVVVIDNLCTGNVNNLNKNSVFYYTNINGPLEDIFNKHKFEYVFHQAAQINLRHSITEPYFDAQTNVLGSLNIIHLSFKHNVRKIFFASTGGAIYDGQAALPWTESTITKPASPYGLAKLTVEKYLELYATLHRLDYTVLRYSNVYGIRQNSHGEAGVISIFADNIKNDKCLTIFGDGTQTRDFVHVRDVVKANLHVLNNKLSGIYNVCTNTETSIIDLAKLMINLSGKNVHIVHHAQIAGEVLKTRLSYDKLSNTGWKPTNELSENLNELIS